MNPQNRKTVADTVSNGAVGSRNEVEMQFDTQVNFHGMHYCMSIEPENTDANANGFWVVLCLPGNILAAGDLPDTFSKLQNDNIQPYIWGMGCWTASNQAPFHAEFAPRTSRTCKKDARIFAYVCITGQSAGNTRINQTLTGFTSL